MRLYHPDYRVPFVERLVELFDVRYPPEAPNGVDLTLLRRAEVRDTRAFLDGVLHVSLLGDEMVRADSTWRPPATRRALAEVTAHLVHRVRFGQVLPPDVHVFVPARWYQLDTAPHGSRLLLRLAAAPTPGVDCFLAGNLDEDGRERWTEYAAGD